MREAGRLAKHVLMIAKSHLQVQTATKTVQYIILFVAVIALNSTPTYSVQSTLSFCTIHTVLLKINVQQRAVDFARQDWLSAQAYVLLRAEKNGM